jgi:hypothetical protein
MAERWKKVRGFPDYDVSDKGRVRTYKGVNQNSPRRSRPRLMRTRIGDGGYVRVTLQDKDGAKVVRRVHLLVARAFLGPAKGKLVLHNDGDRANPARSNLFYGTHKQNSEDKLVHGTHGKGGQNSQALLEEHEVLDIYENPDGWFQQELADYYGISRQAVSDIQNGVTWSDLTGG